MRSEGQHAAAAMAARRRDAARKPGRDQRVGRAIEARRGLSTRRVGRAWINGDEIGGADPRYLHLSRSYD